ncbi:MAG: biotin--[acetyl-CoA-carboxylase] ligase [Flavobacteriales bacterium]|nr:biotin--[acetyl-CoA-carboxylase] ligase [Flavobacteriales bacterium]
MMETLFVGKNTFKFDEIPSTNDWLMNHLFEQSLTEGTLVVAKHQTQGKGQRGSSWEAEGSKALTFSVLFKPHFLNLAQAFDLSVCVALALHDCLSELRPGFSIKWPNDIYFEGKKIAGILIENQISKSAYQHAVVGIGLNVNQTHFENLPQAVSLKQIIGIDFADQQVLERVCECLETRYLQLRAGNYEDLKKAYLSNLYWLHETHTYEIGGRIRKGMITDVLRDGSLQVAFGEHEVQSFDVKEIIFVE